MSIASCNAAQRIDQKEVLVNIAWAVYFDLSSTGVGSIWKAQNKWSDCKVQKTG